MQKDCDWRAVGERLRLQQQQDVAARFASYRKKVLSRCGFILVLLLVLVPGRLLSDDDDDNVRLRNIPGSVWYWYHTLQKVVATAMVWYHTI